MSGRFDELNDLLWQFHHIPVRCDLAGLKDCPKSTACRKVAVGNEQAEQDIIEKMQAEFKSRVRAAVKRRARPGAQFDSDELLTAAFDEFIVAQCVKRARWQCAGMKGPPPQVSAYSYLWNMVLRAAGLPRFGLMDRLNLEVHRLRTGGGDWITFERLLKQCCEHKGIGLQGKGCDDVVREILARFDQNSIWTHAKVFGPDRPVEDYLPAEGNRQYLQTPEYVTRDGFGELVEEILGNQPPQTQTQNPTLSERTRHEFQLLIAEILGSLAESPTPVSAHRMCYAVFRPYYEKAGHFAEAYGYANAAVTAQHQWWLDRLIPDQARNRWPGRITRSLLHKALDGTVEYDWLASTDDSRVRINGSPDDGCPAVYEFWRLAAGLSKKMPVIEFFYAVEQKKPPDPAVTSIAVSPQECLVLCAHETETTLDNVN